MTTQAARGPSAAPMAATPPSTRGLGTFEDFSHLLSTAGRDWPGRGARLRPPVLPRPPLGPGAPGMVPPSPGRLDCLRREPAQEISGHLPDQFLARGRRRPPGSVGGVQVDPGFLVGKRDRHFPGRQSHTKPVAFWEWLIPAVQAEHPDVIFLAEAFTKPAMMAKLGEIGFSQSYTYFTWRTEQHGPEGLRAYIDELTGEKADFMRPNFWPNTPDILSGPLRDGPPRRLRPAFGPGRHSLSQLGHVQRLRAGGKRVRLAVQRGISPLREIRGPQPGLRPTGLAGLAGRLGQRHPPSPPGSSAACGAPGSTTATTR